MEDVNPGIDRAFFAFLDEAVPDVVPTALKVLESVRDDLLNCCLGSGYGNASVMAPTMPVTGRTR